MLRDMKRPVIGWTCTYVPEEILYAAGFHSYRITGGYITSGPSTAYMPSNYCPYTVNAVDEAVNGAYHFLDGLITTNSCIPCELMYDVWKAHLDTEFIHPLDVPRLRTPDALDYFEGAVSKLINTLERHFHITVTDEALIHAAHLHNRIRSLLSALYETRKPGSFSLGGLEMLAITNSNYQMTKEDYIDYLDEKLTHHRQQPPAGNSGKKRILLTGSKIFHHHIPAMVEEYGGEVIFEDMCSFHRSFDGLVEIDPANIIRSICKRYLEKRACPRMHDTEGQIERYRGMIAEYKIDGVIYHTIKFCSSHSINAIAIRDRIKSWGVPLLFIEGDYSDNSLEQIRNRCDTFLELL